VALLRRMREGTKSRGLRSFPGPAMRTEIQNIVDEIRQSVGLLRRHL
jgi:hypothetical protein